MRYADQQTVSHSTYRIAGKQKHSPLASIRSSFARGSEEMRPRPSAVLDGGQG